MRLQLLLVLLVPLAAAAAPAAQAPAVFGSPSRVCAALDDEGFRVGPWRRDKEGFEDTGFLAFKCVAEPVIVPGPGNASFFNSLNYFAEGRTVDRVEIVKLVLNVHDPKSRDKGRAKFATTSAALLRALDITPPPDLMAAIQQARGGNFPTEFGRIRFEVWTVPVERQRLTIESGTALHG